MSLALAIRGSDGLVLASDSRVTLPGEKHDTSEKFLQVNRDMGVLTYGAAIPGYGAITQLVERAKKEKYSTFDQVKEAAARIFKEEYQKWVNELAEEQRSMAFVGFILGGYDHVRTNQFRIVSYDSSQQFAANEVENPTFAAARWHVSEYLMNRIYYPEMTVNQLTELAVFLLLETTTVEDTVGGPIQLASVTLNEGFKRMHPDDIQALIEGNQPRICTFRRTLLDAVNQIPNQLI